MNNKILATHLFCLFLFVGGCVMFWMLGGGEEADMEALKPEPDINVIPDPIEDEGMSVAKTKLEQLEEYQNSMKRKEAEAQAQREFNSLSFFEGFRPSDEEVEEQQTATENVAMTEEQQREALNNIGKNRLGDQSTEEQRVNITHSNSFQANAATVQRTTASSESVSERIEREKKAQMREKHKRIAAATGIDISEQEEPETAADVMQANTVETMPVKASNTGKNKGFHQMGASSNTGASNAIKAVVYGEQKNVTTASQVKLRLLESVTVNGVSIPKNTALYAKASFSANRMHLKTESITYNGSIYPFNAEIYDLDGFEGLYVPDNVVNEAGKQTTSGTVSGASLGVTPAQRIISGMVTSTTSAIKNVASGKIKETKVTLPANYKLIVKRKE